MDSLKNTVFNRNREEKVLEKKCYNNYNSTFEFLDGLLNYRHGLGLINAISEFHW